MTRTRPYKSVPGGLAVAFLLILAWGCGSSRPGASPRAGGEQGDAYDWGQEPEGTRATATGPVSATPAAHWTIVLATFSATGHQQAAARALGQLSTIDPQLAGARVHTTAKGSMAVYGAYESAESADAQRDLAWIKQITVDGRPAFPRAMLTRIRRTPSRGPTHPYDLTSARRRHPTVDPLYTLEVAIWSDFESGKLSREEIRRRAETHATELRGNGFEAYFFHDDDKRISSVTVGLFDRTAIDNRTMIYSPELTALMKQFPARLVNGEPLREPIDSQRPSRGTRVQQPSLVLVPDLD